MDVMNGIEGMRLMEGMNGIKEFIDVVSRSVFYISIQNNLLSSVVRCKYF